MEPSHAMQPAVAWPRVEPLLELQITPGRRFDGDISWVDAFARAGIDLTPHVARTVAVIPRTDFCGQPYSVSVYEEWPFGGDTLDERFAAAAAAGHGRLSLTRALEAALFVAEKVRYRPVPRFYVLHEDGLYTGKPPSQMPLIMTVRLRTELPPELSVEQFGNPMKTRWSKREGGWIMLKTS